MYQFWRQNPLFRPALWVMSGIILEEFYSSEIVYWLVAGGLCLLLHLFLKKYRVSLFLPACFLFLGASLHHQNRVPLSIPDTEGVLRLEVRASPKIKNRYTQTKVQILAQSPSLPLKESYSVLVRLQGTTSQS